MNLGTTAARGISTTATPMTDRAARATVIAAGIKNTTSSGQATTLLKDMRDAMQTRLNNGTTNRDTLVRLAHTTKTGQEMAFQTLDKKWGNKTRTLETKAALIAEFEKAGWDTKELHEYLDTITTRQDRILESRICTILDNAAKKAEAEGPNITVDTQQITTPWDSNSIDHAPKIGEGGQASAYRLQINNEPVVVKIFDPRKLPPPVQLDPLFLQIVIISVRWPQMRLATRRDPLLLRSSSGSAPKDRCDPCALSRSPWVVWSSVLLVFNSNSCLSGHAVQSLVPSS